MNHFENYSPALLCNKENLRNKKSETLNSFNSNGYQKIILKSLQLFILLFAVIFLNAQTPNNGGGGGSFVVKQVGNVPWIIAGGGGGASGQCCGSGDGNGNPGVAANAGTNAYGNSGLDGLGGSGGNGGSAGSPQGAGGGGGFNTTGPTVRHRSDWLPAAVVILHRSLQRTWAQYR